MAWPCTTKHWKEIPVCCNLKPNMKPKMIKMCLLQLCSFFIGDFGLQNVFFEINSATMDLTRLTHQSSAYLLGAGTCSKSDRACVLDLSSKSLWSSLVSCEDTSQARNQSMAACSNQNMTKYNIDANPPSHPAPRAERSSERPLKWTSDVPDTSHCCKKTTVTIT